MSDVEAMDSSALSEEDVEDQQEDKSSQNESASKISAAVGEIVEGKRAKKTVERLDLQAPKQREKLKIGDGSGDKLGEIPRTSYQINKMKPAELKPLHSILFDRPGKMTSIKKNLRLFNGFPFQAGSEAFGRKRDKLLKSSNLTNSKLKVVCTVLDLEKKGTHSDLIHRILTFLIAPKNSGKRVPTKKRRKSKKKLSGDDSKTTKQKKKPKARTSIPKKSKPGSKSKAIVMDSSSDEDEEEAGGAAETGGSDVEEEPSEREESDKSDEEDDDEEEQESYRSNSGREKKKAAAKRPRPPTKKTVPPNKRTKKEGSDESDPDEKPKKKKPGTKTKMADSSSNRNKAGAEDSSDEDKPLIRMMKKPLTEEQLRDTVRTLLEGADLEEMTMKQICQKVFDTYPEHDLSGKKDFIKKTVKAIIT